MRRTEKEITNESAIQSIIRESLVCRLSLSDGAHPYVVPLCFGYEDGALYFHVAQEGRKIDIIRKNRNVCFEFDLDIEVIKSRDACGWGVKYTSVIGFGKAVLIDDLEEKKKALDIIVRHYAGRKYPLSEKALHSTAVIKVEVESLTGKQSGF